MVNHGHRPFFSRSIYRQMAGSGQQHQFAVDQDIFKEGRIDRTGQPKRKAGFRSGSRDYKLTRIGTQPPARSPLNVRFGDCLIGPMAADLSRNSPFRGESGNARNWRQTEGIGRRA